MRGRGFSGRLGRYARSLASLSCIVLTTAAGQARPARSAVNSSELVFIGTQGSGPGQGIVAARFDPSTGALTPVGLAAEIERPTWLVPAAQPDLLYAVSEVGNDGKSQASVYALKADRATGHLSTVSRVPSGGGGATYLALEPRSRTLFVANYGTGQVAALPVRADGGLEPPASVKTDYGSGPTRRQTAPHAHAAVPAPDGRFVVVPDLGADRVFAYRFDRANRTLAPGDPPFVQAAPGSGPRHAVFLKGGHVLLVNSELTGDITAYRWNRQAGRLTPLHTYSGVAAGFTGDRSSAEIAASADSRFVYVSSRGENQIAVYRADAATGVLTELQRVPSGGVVPWSFTLAPGGRWMLVANQGSNSVTVLSVDQRTGILTPTGNTISIDKPVSLAFTR